MPWSGSIALVWNERQGWALALDTGSTTDVVVIQRLGVELLPSPRAVATFTHGIYCGDFTSDPNLAPPPLCDDLADQLPHTPISPTSRSLMTTGRRRHLAVASSPRVSPR
ncbi:DUF6292 family protein [Amycolatopsis thailandensis]|uniref:DUF6292 family protein n=1 Tax=Amycolatopsis thailandensis TaxID=589330 RepID=UPI003CC5A05A